MKRILLNNKKTIILISIIFGSFFFLTCFYNVEKPIQAVKPIIPPLAIAKLKSNDTLIIKYYKKLRIPINIKYARDAVGTILVLPGWNLPDTQWCTATLLCEKAILMHYNLLFVEMQRSVYLENYYPQTRLDYKQYPTRTWLMDSVVNVLQNTEIIYPKNFNYVIGLSTGGRGAAILALEYPNIFKGAACLSGDFDPTLQKDDKLMIYSIGPYDKYKSLWEGSNNIAKRASEMKTPIYIGHGKKDKTSPIIQSTHFAEELKKQNPKLLVKTNFPDSMGHNYKYWDSEVDSVISFFNKINVN